ncbi:transcription termination factor 2 isoform X2 [Corythoichthys intestinalis]|uniref:transcription termination factor 2 isoform X2 n=1 Tax=Corythoichthys intestinalis TaxID=161448 RepID=UPI0025A52EEA|nr:transcription termination factor 2 isoform X2 [Corythoichthys intestinalis]
MEKVACDVHDGVCMLKTGVKDGPNQGKSFYVCVDNRGCDFTKATSISPSHCIIHEDAMVELQALTYSKKQECYSLYYRCIVGKKVGDRWCGNVPWTVPEKEKQNDKQAQASCLPTVRNPFKAPEKVDQESEWRKMQKESESKDKIEKKSKGEEGEDEKEVRPVTDEMYKGKRLPAGMKLKKISVDKKPPLNTSAPKSNIVTSDISTSVPKRDMGTNSVATYLLKSETVSSGVSMLFPKTETDECAALSVPKSNTAPSNGRHLPAGMKLKKITVDTKSRSVPKNTSVASNVSVSAPETDRATSGTSVATAKSSTLVAKNDMAISEGSVSVPKSEIVTSRGSAATDLLPTSVPKHDMAASSVSVSMPKSDMSTSNESIATARTSTSMPKPEVITSRNSDNNTQWRPRQSKQYQDDDDDDDLVLVAVKPPQNTRQIPVAAIQKSLTSYPGFQPASNTKGSTKNTHGMHDLLSTQLQQKKDIISKLNMAALPDKGERLRAQVRELEAALGSLNLEPSDDTPPSSMEAKPIGRPGGTILITAPPPQQQQQPNRGFFQENEALYGGRMTDSRLLAVKNATCEAIDHLHKSLESRPAAEAETPDPKGLKVSLLAHQRQALAWLVWRETQKPCGGILADDMGLGKTLTMIALILAQKRKAKMEEDKEEKEEGWFSKTDCRVVPSKGTLVICPASLVHHWKKEIERHVKAARLSVYLYHGPDRNKNARVLAQHDVVVTTYSLVSREAPGLKEADKADDEASDEPAPPGGSPLLRVMWARVILDEAHNIKNPKVQQSKAVCHLRAAARWAMTGTPIQNNLLDMYSLLKFLRCSPFDEYKLWKAQVDNNSKRGRERLDILTRTLLLRRTKDQKDSHGKALVVLPKRTCKVHHLKLSKDEQAVYDVVFAQSRSTLQNYLKRHEGNDVKQSSPSMSNPFEQVSKEFGLSQSDLPVSSSQQPPQAASTAHILSLLLRLRQCCCHLSLLQKTLDSSELQGDDVVLTLEEQLNALSLTSGPSTSDDAEAMVALNGTRFPSRLFEESGMSTKISAVVFELEAIRAKDDNQKSVIVSQWTSMLDIVAYHLRLMGLQYGLISGAVNPKRRIDLVEEFNNNNPEGIQVMLVSLCAGGVGLNLVGGNHLFLMDMHWNPALEDQACDRIYRVGQKRDVTIHRFVCEGTVEQKISTLQAKKQQLAQSVLSGTGSAVAKLSLADLKIIFGV